MKQNELLRLSGRFRVAGLSGSGVAKQEVWEGRDLGKRAGGGADMNRDMA